MQRTNSGVRLRALGLILLHLFCFLFSFETALNINNYFCAVVKHCVYFTFNEREVH